MHFVLANPGRTNGSSVAPPSRSSSWNSCTPPASSSSCTDDHNDERTTSPAASSNHVNDRLSLRSFVSTSEVTAVSDHPTINKPSDHHHNSLSPKGIMRLRSENGEKPPPPRRSRSGDTQYDEPLHTTAVFTTTSQLAAALGPDNAPHTIEIASVPCAGVRIPHGPLTGLLAWRLVVRDPKPRHPPLGSRRASWWGGPPKKTRVGTTRMRTAGGGEVQTLAGHAHAYSYSDLTPPPNMKDLGHAAPSTTSLPGSRPQYTTSISAAPAPVQSPRVLHDAVATNFILDTSLPQSIISRDTLRALGYAHMPPDHVAKRMDDEDQDEGEDSRETEVEVTIQGVRTRVRIARTGEAGRLGVQFLRDAGVSVFFPRDGEGVGPVLYYEAARTLRDVPITIPSLPRPQQHGRSNSTRDYYARWKPTLPQRVRSFLGLVGVPS